MAPFSMLKLVVDQFATLNVEKQDLSGKTIIVTGANVGLGMEAARHFARDAAVLDIVKTTSCRNIECWKLDLADFSSVSAFADRFEQEGGGRLDLLVENAAMATLQFEQTKDGWEQTIQVNNLGTALLAFRLLPILSKTPASTTFPRIVIVASEGHFFVKRLEEYDSEHILNKLNDKEAALMDVRYYVSKLLNVFFTRAFAARLRSNNPVAIDVLTPGFCYSELRREFPTSTPFVARWGMRLLEILIARSAEYGSRTLVHAGLWGTKSEVHGKYLNRCRVEEESDYVIGAEGQKCQDRLWVETVDILKKVDPKVEGILKENFMTV